MSFETTLGWRYTRAKRRNRFVSFIALTSMIGIALGVAALIIVLSVMNGFQAELRSRILAASAHVQVRGADGPITDPNALAAQIKTDTRVQALASYVEGEALFSMGGNNRPGLLRGIDPATETQVAELAQHMKEGQLTDLRVGEFGILLGRDLALLLGVRVGEKVIVTIPQGTATPAGTVPRSKAFRVVGLFELGYQEIDSRVALIHIADAQRLYQLDSAVSGFRVRLNDLMTAPKVAAQWLNTFPTGLAIADWTRQHATLFRAVEMEKRVMFIILTLIVAVAAFNLVSTLVMAVTEKQADIAILRTLGAAPRSILGIFMLQGILIGLVGTLLGALLGIVVAQNVDVIVPFIEHSFGIAFMDKSVYQISEVPSKLDWNDVRKIVSISIVLSLLATIYPAWRASKTPPAEALRYE